MVRKAITCIITLLLIFNCIMPSHVLASGFDQADFNQIDEQGSVTRPGQSGDITTTNPKISNQKNENSSNFNLIGSVLTFLFLPLPIISQALLTLAIMPEKVTKIQMFTIEDMLFGRLELFDVDFMNPDGKSSISDDSQFVASQTNVLIKKNVAGWFFAIRNFAIVALFAVLIAIGILMAVSSIASERARYKNMLIHWVVSFVILMILPYIMAIVFTVNEALVTTIRQTAESIVVEPVNQVDIEQTKGLNFEKTLVYGRTNTDGKGFDGIFAKIGKGNSWESFSLMLVYMILAFYQIKFFFMYIKRMISVGFLMVISPLITITYSIDKAGDNQAQAFKTWVKEFMINVFVQPLHAVLFLIFMYSIYGIMERAPLLAIIFLAALSRGEQLFRTIFKIDRTTALGHLGRRGKGR